MPRFDRNFLRQLLLLLGIALVLGFAASGARGLYETTEGRYAESAREMIETGTYLQPQLAHRPHLTKPPLTYWAIAGGMHVFGENEFGARACNGLAFLISVFAVLGIGTLLWDRRTGLVAGFVYGTSLLSVVGAHSLSTDTLLTMFELLTVLAWLAAVKSTDRKRERRFVFLAWVALGLGVLTKGPAALVPLAPILAYDFSARRLFRLFSPAGIAVCVALGLGWYAAIVLRDPSTLEGMVNQQLTGRLFANEYNRNDEWYQPFRVYFPLVAFGCGPWMWFAVRAWKKHPELRPLALVKGLRTPTPGPALLLLFWIVPPLAVFSLAQSRLPLYVLPLCAPVALGAARGLVLVSEVPVRRAIQVALPLAAVLLGGMLYAADLPHPNDMRALDRAITAAAGADAQVFSFEEEFLYGLRFYRHGAMARLSADPEAAYPDAPLDASLAEGAKREVVYVTKAYRAPALAERLKAHDVAFRRVDAGRWALLVSEPAAAGGAAPVAAD